MIARLIAGAALACAAPVLAQVFPQPDGNRERIQSVRYVSGQQVVLTMLPDTPLTVVLEPGDAISDVRPGHEGGFTTRVSAERDSFTILPLESNARSTLEVTTRQRDYRFLLKVDYGPEAALLVRYDYGASTPAAIARPASTQQWTYRFRGDREVRPQSVTDDGYRTTITYAPGQPLPAVFAIGPTGEEEVVNGYMRGEVFEIDCVYEELVFRIDKEKATARRSDKPEAKS